MKKNEKKHKGKIKIFGSLKKKKEKKRKREMKKKNQYISALISTPLYPSARKPFHPVFLILLNCIPIHLVTKIQPLEVIPGSFLFPISPCLICQTVLSALPFNIDSKSIHFSPFFSTISLTQETMIQIPVIAY